MKQRRHKEPERATQNHMSNPDARGLEPIAFGPGRIGEVPHVNGELAKTCPSYPLTVFELHQVARFWCRLQREIDDFHRDTKTGGSTEYREHVYADRRLNRIARIIGKRELERLMTDERSSEAPDLLPK